MFSVVQMISALRVMILAWVIIWVAIIPLFHTHLPDLSNGPAALQGGVAHTVFTPDLPGEFSRFSHVTHPDHFAQVSNRISNSPELNFVLSSEDSKSRKLVKHSVLVILCDLPNTPFLPNSAIESQPIPRKLLVFEAPQGPRAPPSVVSF